MGSEKTGLNDEASRALEELRVHMHDALPEKALLGRQDLERGVTQVVALAAGLVAM